MGKRLGGDTARTVGLNSPQGSSESYNSILSKKLRKNFSKVAVPQRLAGHQYTGGE